MKKHMKHKDGMYHIHGKKYAQLVGSRVQVANGTAYKTSGDLKAGDLFYNKHGRYVSKKLHALAKKEKRLEKAGYFTQKGKFGAVKRSAKVHHKKHHKKHHTRGKARKSGKRGKK